MKPVIIVINESLEQYSADSDAEQSTWFARENKFDFFKGMTPSAVIFIGEIKEENKNKFLSLLRS